MSGLVGFARPVQPDASLLQEAAESLQELLQLEDTPRWSVTARDVRKRSTLFRLAATHQFGVTYAWAKVDAPTGSPLKPGQFERILARVQDSLMFEQQVSPLLAVELGEHNVAFDRPLAINVAQLSAVRLEVPGRELGHVLNRMLPGRRRAGAKTFSQVGSVVRCVETVSGSFGPSFDEEWLERHIEAELDRVRGKLTTALHRRVSELAHELAAGIDLNRSSVRGHGDLSPTNILVDSGRLGLIDFSWRRFLAGESVAYFVARLSIEPRTPLSWKRAAVAAVLEGYRCDEVASWRLAYLMRLLRWSAKSAPDRRDWARAEMSAFLAVDSGSR